MLFQVPVLPDPDEAHDWLEQELQKPAYTEAEPTWFDRIAKAIFDFFDGLTKVDGGNPTNWFGLVVGALVIVAIVVLAIVLWGRPRTSGASRAGDDLLFNDDDERSADELRQAARARFAAQDYTEAIVLHFRALARALTERGAVMVGRGATVHAFAAQAATAFPDRAGELDTAAALFDDVRYLRRPGTPESYEYIAALDASLARTRPAALAPIGADA